MKRTVTFYRTADGKCPLEVFLDSLSGRTAQKVTWVLRLLEEREVVSSSYLKKIVNTEEIWECRVQYGSNSLRILCFFSDNASVVLTNGFLKKSRKTPIKEIERAEAYRRDFIRRRIRS